MASNIVAIKLTEQQEKFVRALCRRGDIQVAAREAGYSESSIEVAGRLIHQPAIAAAIRIEITRRLNGEALPLAYSVLCEIARDVAAPAAVRRAAARDLMDRAGFVAPKAAEAAATEGKSLHEMSSEELRALVDKLESELGARAVDVTPADNAHKPQAGKAKSLSFLG